MGIGGLDKEFSDIFRRAFASRVFPLDIVEQMGEFLSERHLLLRHTHDRQKGQNNRACVGRLQQNDLFNLFEVE